MATVGEEAFADDDEVAEVLPSGELAGGVDDEGVRWGRWAVLAWLEGRAASSGDAVLGEFGEEGGGALDVAGDDE